MCCIQVCRIAYEIMQTRHIDAADRFKSLDDIFYFGGQSEHLQVYSVQEYLLIYTIQEDY